MAAADLLSSLFDQALHLHQQDDLPGAAALYRDIIRQDAVHFDALHLLGMIAAQTGDPAGAVALIDRAIAVDDRQAPAHFHRALALRDLMRHQEALASLAHALALDPRHVEARLCLAQIHAADGRAEQALVGYQAVLDLMPGHGQARFDRALLLYARGDQVSALAEYDELLAREPDFAAALNNRALILQALGRHEEALESFTRLSRVMPTHAPAYLGCGIALAALGRSAEALAAYDRALAAEANHADAHLHRARLLHALARSDEALVAYGAFLAAAPNDTDIWFEYAHLLQTLQRGDESLAAYERALALRPDFAEAWVNCGLALRMLRRPREAVDACQRAVELRPDFTPAHVNLAQALAECDRPLEAAASFERAAALAPASPEALMGYAAALQAGSQPAQAIAAYEQAYQIAPSYPYLAGNYLNARLYNCDWRNYAPLRAGVEEAVRAGECACAPFIFLAISADAAAQQRCARSVASGYASGGPAIWRGERYAHDRVRIGYVSGDLGFHPVSYLLAEVLECHDGRRFELSAFYLRAPGSTPFDLRIRNTFEHVIDVSAVSPVQAAQAMREREIDVAIDLTGYSNPLAGGVFARRPAPVQALYLGYAGTLALPGVDYMIADAVATPAAAAAHYSEELVLVPGTFMPRDTTLVIPPPPTRAQAGLPAQGLVFCCFNNAYKLNPPVFDIWMRLLLAVPGSVVWITDPGTLGRENLLREAGARGVAAERLVFAARTPRVEDHLARLPLADLFLDTYPYNAHTTASDAVWAGVPLLTCTGEAMASRVAASLITAAGLPELVTDSLDAYEARALELARDPARLWRMREQIASRRAAGELFNPVQLCRHLEAAYLHMHERARQGLPPQGVSIAL